MRGSDFGAVDEGCSVLEQTHPFVPREAETRYLSELGEICAHLIFIETVGNLAEINYTRF